MRLCVAQADQYHARVPLFQEPLAVAMQNHEGFTTFLAAYFHVLPAKLRADAGPERLGNRLFRRKTRSQKWSRRLCVRQ
jgi:hypothetical protein